MANQEINTPGNYILNGIVGTVRYVTPGMSNPSQEDILCQVETNLCPSDEDEKLGVETIVINVTEDVSSLVIGGLSEMGSMLIWGMEEGEEQQQAGKRAVEIGLANLDITFEEQEEFFKTGEANLCFYNDIEDCEEIFYIWGEDEDFEDEE